jgi:hypothetical protein
MNARIPALVLTLFFPCCVSAQQRESGDSNESKSKPEEIVIIGERALRMQMMAAERKAYDIFNQFNDEKRFNISCSISKPIGTHFEKQTCSPAFQITATKEHAQTYFDEYRAFLDTWTLGIPYNMPSNTYESPEVAIPRQRAAYKLKMKEVAEQHPEFLEAIKEYAKLREQYEGASGARKK